MQRYSAVACRPSDFHKHIALLLISICVLSTISPALCLSSTSLTSFFESLLSSQQPTSAAVVDPPHPDPQPMGCGLQLWCTPEAPCMPNQAQYALVTFDLSSLTINHTASANATDYMTSDAVNTYYANVCASTRRNICGPPPPVLADDYGVVQETDNPGGECFPTGHQPDPAGFQLINSLDVNQGLQMRYINGEYASPCSQANPRQVNMVYECVSGFTPYNPFQSASVWPTNQCNFTFTFKTSVACPTITYYGYPPQPSHPSRLSGGSIFLIVFFVLIAVYAMCTMIFNYAARGARTCKDLAPHPAIWRALFQNAVLGCVVTYTWLRARCGSREAQEESRANDYQDIDDNKEKQMKNASALGDAALDVEDVTTPTSYISHFADDRDEVGVSVHHAPLSAKTQNRALTEKLYEDDASFDQPPAPVKEKKKNKKGKH